MTFLSKFLTTWASGNYSAAGKTWDASAKAMAPASDGFTPDAVIAAEDLNYVFKRGFDETNTALQGIYDTIKLHPLLSMRDSSIGPSSLSGIVGVNERLREVRGALTSMPTGTGADSFLTAIRTRNNSTNYTYIYYTFNNGAYWQRAADGTATDPLSVGNFTSAEVRFGMVDQQIVLGTSSTAGKVRMYNTTSGTWVDVTTGEGTMNAAGFSCIIQRHGTNVSSGRDAGLVMIGYTGAATKATLCTANGGTFTSLTASIPGALSTSQSFVGCSSDIGLVVALSTAANQTTFMYLPSGSNTWSSGTSPVGATEAAVDVAWGGGYFWLTTQDGTTARLYKWSGSGSWTLVKTTTTTTITGISCEPTGSLLVMSVYGGVSGTQDSLLVSYDSGAVPAGNNWFSLRDASINCAVDSTNMRVRCMWSKPGFSKWAFFNPNLCLMGRGSGP